jgi:hypothetical protein
MKAGVIRFLLILFVITMASSTMMAADWNAFDLKGRVKSVTYYNRSSPYMWPYNEEVRKYSFNISGYVIAPKDVKVIRNKSGVAINFQYYLLDWDHWFDQALTYSSNGRLVRVSSDNVDGGYSKEMYYDEQGRVSKEIVHGCAEGDDYQSVIRYEYISFDIKGNWIKRVSRTYTSYPGSGYPSGKSTEIETRQIIYYE